MLRRVLQASCLLLFVAAAVSGRGLLESDEDIAVSSLPAQVQPMATNCVKNYGLRGCKWNTTCSAILTDCLLCERAGRGSPNFNCLYCKPGFFNTVTPPCTKCPFSFWCAGSGANACGAGTTTSADGQWDPSQCNTCIPGYSGSPCSACPTGMFKPIAGNGPCSYCPTGTIANMNTAATACVPSVVGVTNGLDPNVGPGTPAFQPNVTACPKNASPNNEQVSCECDAGFATSMKVSGLNAAELSVPDSAFLPKCTACGPGTASSANDPKATGATSCTACPANSEAASVSAGGNNVCICKNGFVPNGANPKSCPPGKQCPTSFTAGCVRPPRPDGDGGHDHDHDDEDDDDEHHGHGHWKWHGKKGH